MGFRVFRGKNTYSYSNEEFTGFPAFPAVLLAAGLCNSVCYRHLLLTKPRMEDSTRLPRLGPRGGSRVGGLEGSNLAGFRVGSRGGVVRLGESR